MSKHYKGKKILISPYLKRRTEEKSNIGQTQDLKVLEEVSWLLDAAVLDEVKEYRGEWTISLIFVSSCNPLRLLRRKIKVCRTRKNAEMQANYMRRNAAKDSRGTIKIDFSKLNISPN